MQDSEIVNLIHDLPFPSTQGMAKEDKVNGVKRMLFDLSDMARIDGNVAAAWAIELAAVAANQAHALNLISELSSKNDNESYRDAIKNILSYVQ